MYEENVNRDIVVPNNPLEVKIHQCKFCDKTFNSLQAFGGHQNKHRAKRAEIRRAKKELERPCLVQPYSLYYASPTYNNFPYNNPIGSYRPYRRSWPYPPPPRPSYQFAIPSMNPTFPSASHTMTVPPFIYACRSGVAGPSWINGNQNVNGAGNGNRNVNASGNGNANGAQNGEEELDDGLDLTLHL